MIFPSDMQIPPMPPVEPPRVDSSRASNSIGLTIELKADSLESLDEFMEMAEKAGKQHPGISVHMVVKIG